ncbi:MAG: FAD-dependent oxidoreductase, partial [Chloroflexi bacterium]|nr:FAD-dependent oxidoreductase [Chloroflexota bacterium]
RQLEQLGVRVVLGRAYDAALARRDAPDAVVVATGVTPLIPDLPGVDLPHVVTAFDVLAGRVDVGRRVAIIGARGTGCDTALYLSEQQATDPQAAVFLAGWGAVGPDRAVAMAYSRRPIALMRRGDRVADDIGRTVRWILLEELGHAGIEVLTGVEYEEITPEGVRVRVGDESRLVPADTVILATGGISNNGLAAELEAVVPEVHLIGDAKKIRDAVDAIYEAAIVGRAI